MGDKSSTELAEERTDWAEDRTIQANERTFAGWMRTGLASVGMGLALHAIFGKSDQIVLAKSASTLFIVIGIGVFASAYFSARAMLNRLSAHSAEPKSSRAMAITAGSFAGAAVLVGVILWMI